MKAGRLVLAMLVLHSLSLAVWCNSNQNFSLSGHILTRDSKNNGRFNAKLYPPKASGRPVLLTTADSAGNFKFTDLPVSSYLLEVYLGTDMVNQQVIALDNNKEITIDLR
jgi:hypothetical protein